MIKRFIPILFLSALLLSACSSTIEGIQRDFGNITTSIDDKVTDLRKPDDPQSNAQASVIFNGACPSINIDPQLDSMSEFYDMEKPSAKSEISTIKIVKTATECSTDAEFLTMRIDLSFEGKLGPKARRKDGDRPFFAYPYFVAVLDGEGNELAKELFAASVTYTAEQNDIQLVDTIRQKLPLNDDGTVPPYQVQIGFQLTEDQLFYNSSL